MKSEMEKRQLESVRNILQKENHDYAKDALTHLQAVKKINAELEELRKEKKIFIKQQDEFYEMQGKLAAL